MSTKHVVKNNHHPFNQLLRNFWGEDLDAFESFLYGGKQQYHPNISLSEDDNKVYVDAALPGLEENEIEVTLEKGILWIQGQKQESEDHKKYHYKAKSAYSYQIALPDSINESEEAYAKYDKGVLHIVFNKTKGDGPKKISINKIPNNKPLRPRSSGLIILKSKRPYFFPKC